MTDVRTKIFIKIPKKLAAVVNLERQKSTYRRALSDHKMIECLLPCITQARALGYRRLDDLLPVVRALHAKSYPNRKLITRTTLYRALLRLRALKLDPGPDDLSTARQNGRPTRGPKDPKAPSTGTEL